MHARYQGLVEWLHPIKDGLYEDHGMPVGQGRLLYSPDTGRLIVAGHQASTEAILDHYCDKRSVIPSDEEPSCGLRSLFIMPTYSCNLACVHCHVRKHDHGAHRVSREHIDQALQYACEHLRGDHLSIIMSGGEPFLAWELVMYSVAASEKLVEKGTISSRSFGIYTNGTLLDEDHADYLADHSLSVFLSLDGPQHIHDRARRFRDGTGSYTAAIEGLRILQEKDVAVTASLTLGPHNIDTFPTCIEHIISDLGIKNTLVSVYHDNAGERALNPRAVAEASLLGHGMAERLGGSIDTVYRRLVPLGFRMTADRSCDCQCSRITLLPNGQISLCTGLGAEEEHFYGRIAEGEFERSKQYLELRCTAKQAQLCRDCPARQVCNGGCILNAIRQGGVQNHVDDYYCYTTIEVMKEAFATLRTALSFPSGSAVVTVPDSHICDALSLTEGKAPVAFLKGSDVYRRL